MGEREMCEGWRAIVDDAGDSGGAVSNGGGERDERLWGPVIVSGLAVEMEMTASPAVGEERR